MPSIYKLIDPFTNKVRYVGLTNSPLTLRLKNHINCKRKTPVNVWIQSLDGCPIIKLIENVDSSISLDREKYWILRHSKKSKLLNIRHLRTLSYKHRIVNK